MPLIMSASFPSQMKSVMGPSLRGKRFRNAQVPNNRLLLSWPDMGNLQLECFHRDGMVVIRNALPEAFVDKMKDKMVTKSKALQDLGDVHFHQGKTTRNMSVYPHINKV